MLWIRPRRRVSTRSNSEPASSFAASIFNPSRSPRNVDLRNGFFVGFVEMTANGVHVIEELDTVFCDVCCCGCNYRV